MKGDVVMVNNILQFAKTASDSLGLNKHRFCICRQQY
jgi:hypothetical protein